ncbi:alanine racemase [Streptococcaceae bacterium ESL0687]|nr:alanine racemase [Streptococcaceae bacterium ESL0687]
MKTSVHRPTRIIVNLENIRENIHQIKSHLPDQTMIYAVVKANSYGHGAVQVSQAVESLVAGFAVSNLDEALELRENGILKDILVLSGINPEDINLALEHNISLTVPSLDWLHHLTDEYQAGDLSDLKVHLKVDSGMGRIGIRNIDEINEVIDLLDDHQIVFEGIFTHFATADEESHEKFNQQEDKFDEILAGLKRKPNFIHSSNSAASIWHEDTVRDIVRFGDAMYGLNPSGRALNLPFDLKPALSLESELTHVKHLPAGETVGYGATYTSDEDIFVGTLPIGYADGWTRDMQGFEVLVDGKRMPIIGRVSMDQTTIKLDQEYPLGTKVTLIGKDSGQEITVDDIADKRGTINYEVVCLLSDRIYRTYDMY